jgi:hypothetical protein
MDIFKNLPNDTKKEILEFYYGQQLRDYWTNSVLKELSSKTSTLRISNREFNKIMNNDKNILIWIPSYLKEQKVWTFKNLMLSPYIYKMDDYTKNILNLKLINYPY